MKETIENLRKVYKYGKQYKSSLIWQLVGCIIGIIIHIIFPLVYARFVVEFTTSVWEQAIYMACLMLFINIIDRLHTVLIRKNTQIFRRGTVRNLQKALGRQVLSLEQSTIDANSSGTFIQRIISDTDKMSSMFTVGMGELTGVLSNIGSFIAVFIIDYHMFIYYFVSALVLTLLSVLKSNVLAKKDVEFRNQSDKVAGLTGELVRGARDIKMLYAKDSFMEEFDNNIVLQNEKNFDMRNVDILYEFIIGIAKRLFEFGMLMYLICLIRNNVLSVAVALALYGYRVNIMADMMGNVSRLLEETKNFNISCNRVFDIIDGKKFAKETFGKKHIKNIEGSFEFKDVCFSYDNKNQVLKNLNLKVEANKTYGIVGKSGEGKTTMFNLLCKLYNCKSGTITIDGINIDELDEESIRGNITIISQNPYIFNLSIKDNLRLVKKNITDKEIKDACNLACLNEFIESLPDKYDTIVGEGGVSLSGGQRQRLAIARALIQKTKIILFDEATSALDNETQNNIQQAINNLKEDYTIVIIAHRLSTIMNCDKIFFMQNGNIINEGTHDNLLKKCKGYKDLYEYEIKQN